MNDTPVLSSEQIAEYEQNGYVVAKGIISPEDALQWKTVLKARLVADGQIDKPSGVKV